METRAKFHFSWVYTFSVMLAPCGTEQTTTDSGCDPALLQNCVDYLDQGLQTFLSEGHVR